MKKSLVFRICVAGMLSALAFVLNNYFAKHRGLEKLPKLDDTVDSIAIAICHTRSVMV